VYELFFLYERPPERARALGRRRYGAAYPRTMGMRARWVLSLAVSVAVCCAPVCTGVHSSSARRAAGASASSQASKQPRAAAFAASPAIMAPEPHAAVANRPQAVFHVTLMPRWAMRRAGLQQCLLLTRALSPARPTPGTAGVQLSMTSSGDDADDDLKQEYQRADADGTRIFISGLLPSVDEKRLLVLLQSFKGVRDAQLAKPGVGFALFADPASADAALQRLQGAKLGGKVITARRARSFYIQQQQQATMRDVMDQVRARLHACAHVCCRCAQVCAYARMRVRVLRCSTMLACAWARLPGARVQRA
jgi:hypothetical protein